MKIIFDNIIFSLQKTGGISVVWTNLLTGIMNTSTIDYQCIEYIGAANNLFRKRLQIPKDRLKTRLNRLLSIKRYINPSIKHNDTPFIFHSSYYRYCKNKNAINFTTVHDFTYEYYATGIKKRIHCFQKYQAIKHSDYIICISETTKNDLFKFMPQIEKSNVHIVYNGVSVDYFPMGHKDSSTVRYGDYIIFIGTRKGYKNFDLAVKGIKNSRFNLVIVGNKLTSSEKELLIDELGANRFFELGRISNAELNKIYNAAFCLLYPSLYEGFGIPVLEAQKAGCPVITSDAPSVVEIIGDTTLVATNEKSIMQKIQLLENIGIREQLIHLGLENAKKYSWEKMQYEMIALYKMAFSNK